MSLEGSNLHINKHIKYMQRARACMYVFRFIRYDTMFLLTRKERERENAAIDKREFDKGRRRENIELIEPLE